MAASTEKYAEVIEMTSEPVTPSAGSEVGLVILTAEPDQVPDNVQELPPMDGGWQAWLFISASFVVEMLVWGFVFSYGIFQAYYTSHPPYQGKSAVAIAAVGPVAIAFQYVEALLLSFILGRYPELHKPMMWSGLILVSGSLLLSSFVSQVEILILLQGVFLGIGSGMMYWPSLFLVPDWFTRRRGLATGIVFAGSGVGGFVFPFIVQALLDGVGFRWTLRIWAAIMAVCGGLAIPGVRRRIPIQSHIPGQKRLRLIPRNLQFIHNPLFWAFSFSILLQAMSYFPVSLYISVFTTTISSPLSASIVLALFNSSGVIGQILIGYLTDRMPYPQLMVISTLGSSIAAFLLWGFADTLGRVFAFAIIFGGLGGGFSSVISAGSFESAGANPEQAPMAISAVFVSKGIAAFVGPILSGILLEAGKSAAFGGRYGKFGFGPVEIFVGTCAAATSVSSLAVAAMRPRLNTM
ncbi:hypothetical protein EIP91_001009 [Steccherinum ochraceum]|uniref:Major facilitator superfamily (MFS) profile domain-containing protein n=1 Tax=Steccherinum ochraceum TaxID=92696 RepID=A0A4R0RH70_9APHY|nr:hypothetical protein EIP91_001009 [Steccherinum ochraceum]